MAGVFLPNLVLKCANHRGGNQISACDSVSESQDKIHTDVSTVRCWNKQSNTCNLQIVKSLQPCKHLLRLHCGMRLLRYGFMYSRTPAGPQTNTNGSKIARSWFATLQVKLQARFAPSVSHSITSLVSGIKSVQSPTKNINIARLKEHYSVCGVAFLQND